MVELRKQIDAYSNKVKLLGEHLIRVAEEELQAKVLELSEKTGERKHLK